MCFISWPNLWAVTNYTVKGQCTAEETFLIPFLRLDYAWCGGVPSYLVFKTILLKKVKPFLCY